MTPVLTEADYVVVGAGSAGCVLAARLSEEGGVERRSRYSWRLEAYAAKFEGRPAAAVYLARSNHNN